MKINRITLWSVDLTSHETYYMAEGKTCATVKTHVLCLETDTGLKGWGEVCPIPQYLEAFADGVPSAATELAPYILGLTPTGIDTPMRHLDIMLEQPGKTLEDCAAVRDLTVHLGAVICAECTWGSDIVTAASLHFAASTPQAALLNTCDLSGYVGPRLAPDGPTRKDGRIAPPEGAGLGITPDHETLGTPVLELN